MSKTDNPLYQMCLEQQQVIWMYEVIMGAVTEPKEVMESLKEYEKREDLRKDFAEFFEQANKSASKRLEDLESIDA